MEKETIEKTDGSYGIERKRTAEEILAPFQKLTTTDGMNFITEKETLVAMQVYADQFKVGEEVVRRVALVAWKETYNPEWLKYPINLKAVENAFNEWFTDFKSTHPELFGGKEPKQD